MNQKDAWQLVTHLGFSEKAARLYLAAVELGEGTVQELSRCSGVERTTAYYSLPELIAAGALFHVRRNKRAYYVPELPHVLLQRIRERLGDVDNKMEVLESNRRTARKKPEIQFLYGPSGFKHVWDMVLSPETKEFCITTEGLNFLDFVKERYIIDDIIKKKKRLSIKSRQIIVDSPYARKIVSKDFAENRQSRILPGRTKLPFTEIVTDEFVAFISPRLGNTIFVVENTDFATTRKHLFNALWEKLSA